DGIRDATVTGVQTCALPIWPARLLPRRRRDTGDARRSGAAADGQAARHLQQVRPHREDAVLGVADAAALRFVLGDPQHEGADAEIGRASCRERINVLEPAIY